MRGWLKRVTACLLAAVMVCATFMQWLPPMEVQAAQITKDMAHLVSTSNNGNGHFGGGTPEAFVLSEKTDITNEEFSFTMKLGSESGKTRFRFVNKYVDDSNWSFIGYDNGWLYQYKVAVGTEVKESWPGITGLPTLNKNDVAEVSGRYTDAGLEITVVNKTQNNVSGTFTITDTFAENEAVTKLKDQSGKIGFGAGYFNSEDRPNEITDVYVADATIGTTKLEFVDFQKYGNSEFTWGQVDDVIVGDDGIADDQEEAMAHLVSISDNGNGHFGGGTPEAFVLSEKTDITNEEFSFTMKLGSESGKTRFRFVNKYVDDSNWSFIGYDNGWLYQYKVAVGTEVKESWPGITGLPTLNKNDVAEVSGRYTDAGLEITVVNKTQNNVSGTFTITDTFAENEAVTKLKDQSGKIGFGAGYFNSEDRPNEITDVYVADTTVGTTKLKYADFAKYNDAEFTWELATEEVGGDEGGGETPPAGGGDEDDSALGRKWITLTGGSNNGGGHNYGNAASAGPLFYTDTDRTMLSGGTIELALKPSNNWGVFYSYIDDNNWLYVGYDNSSKWYYQYKWNGQEQYPGISGLPEPVEGEELSLKISLSNETLAVTVNGTTAYATNQKLKDMANALAESNGNLGKFGVMTKGQTTIRFADFKYDNADCMNDTWAFNAEREGQLVEVTYTAVKTVTGTVKNAQDNPLKGATVRIGTKSAVTDDNGAYTIEGVQVGIYTLAVSKAGYQAYTQEVTIVEDGTNNFDAVLQLKPDLDLNNYDSIASDDMTVYIGKEFPVVVRYVMKNDATGKTFFRGNETALNQVVINGTPITPAVTVKETKADYRIYTLDVESTAKSIDFKMDVKISVEDNTLTWEVVKLTKADGCAKIATIDIPNLNLLSVDAAEEDSVFAGAQVSTTTTDKADTYITFDDGFIPANEDGYVYAFLSNGKLSAGLHSNSEIEGDKRVERINGADSISLTSAVWYYESGDSTGQAHADKYDYQVSELPVAKVAIASDLNNDEVVDWNDGAIAFRDIMHYAQGTEAIKDIVNYRIVMNFESAAPNPFLQTADNVKKVYLATDGLPQALLLKGYGNEGHDSANSEYADIAEREGGVDDFQDLIKIAHEYNTEVGIHVNAQEAYPESRSFNETMVSNPNGNLNGNGWGWLDQSVVINKLWDLSSDARLKRFVQLYDRINGTKFLSLDWEEKEYVKDSQGFFTNGDGVTEVSREEVMDLIKADTAKRPDNMDFIYLDVWYQDAWETRRIAEEINSLDWRFSTEFSGEGEYDSTWQHWSTDTTYGGAGAKGYNSDIIRFLKNDLRDSQVLNWPEFGGTADNPLLGGFRLYGFEGWGGQQDFNEYIKGTFTENLPTKFLQQYQILDWQNYAEGESPVENTEKQITLGNAVGDKVVVTRNESKRDDIEIERTITLNGKVVLNTDANVHTYLLPWIDNQNGEAKLYHWNLDGGESTWELQEGWKNLSNVVVYELSDQGRINEKTVAVSNGEITLDAKAATAYVVVKGAAAKTLKADFGECENVVDPGFNGYTDGAKLDAADWSGDINAEGVQVIRTKLGDQKLEMSNTKDDVSVTTKLTDLTKGKSYVAELYVANESDARAALTVNTGSKEVSVYTDRSIATNYVYCDSEHGTQMNRMQVSFVAEGETAAFTLSRTAGEGYTHWDDIRIVEQKVENYKADGNFEQDFESVVQGLYPFVLGYNAGGDSRTHLSQLNAPYTQKGWNGKFVDDVLGGEWSLKHHSKITGLAYRTIPQNFRFEPGKVYKVEFDYQTKYEGYQMVVGEGTSYERPTEYLQTTDTTAHAEMQIVGSGSGQTFIGLYMDGSKMNDKAVDTSVGNIDFILDNLKITEVKDAKVVTLSETELYLGETADIYGNNLEQIKWSFSEEGIVAVDQKTNQLKALKAGTVTVTATYPSKARLADSFTFKLTVIDSVVVDIPREEYAGISATANTEHSEGYASATVDGDSSTYWHSNYDAGFTASPTNPAVLTVDLGKTMEIGGFKFQQRNQANRVVLQYGYEIQDADGKVLKSASGLTTNAGAGEWVTVSLDKSVDAKKIVFKVEKAHTDGHACLAEIAPIGLQKVATEAEITGADKVMADSKETLTAKPKKTSEMLKGLVWSSSDESVATVNQQGVVTGVKAGTVIITLSNATGVLATHAMTVEVNENAPVLKGDLKVEKVTKDSITVSWKAAEDKNNDVVGYEVYVNGEYITTVTETEAMIGNLKAGTTYEIGVRAIDESSLKSDVLTVSETTKAELGKPGDADKPGDAGSSSKPGSSSSSGKSESSDKKSDSSVSTSRPVVTAPTKTGDSAPIAIFAVVMVAAIAAVVFVQKKRKEY